ncbi:hypothetical protein Tco_0677441 [Tanacetum coccineum]|uniref:Ty3-gypsy retrotransposon protein n=1 Tax=Tanacetum coccineum TaxID=301880 RepID=A0ABQ4XDJ2_9ASTR
MASLPVSNAFGALGDMEGTDKVVILSVIEVKTKEDKEKSKDDLVKDTRKNADPIKRKSCFSPGRKKDTPKRNIVFSPSSIVHYFEIEDMKYVVEDMEQIHVTSLSGNG